MIGYLKPNRKEMTPECREAYQGIYCGLCHSLRKQYGLRGLACLSYELTTFLMVILAMQEDEVRFYRGSCCLNPMLHVPFVDYLDDLVLSTADVSIAVAGLEIEDNVSDEGSLKWKLAQRLLRGSMEKAKFRLEDAFAQMEAGAQKYYALERIPESDVSELLESCGDLIQTILEPVTSRCPEEQQPGLRRLANVLGRWICLADACDDAAEDRETGTYNILNNLSDPRAVGCILDSIRTEIVDCVESLPVQRFREVIHWVLISELHKTGERVLEKYERGVNPNGSRI